MKSVNVFVSAGILLLGLYSGLASASPLAKRASLILSDPTDQDSRGKPSITRAQIVGVQSRDPKTLVLRYQSNNGAFGPGTLSDVVLTMKNHYEAASLGELLHEGKISCIPAKIWVLNYHRIGMDGVEISGSTDSKCSKLRVSEQIKERALELRHRDEFRGKFDHDLLGTDDWTMAEVLSIVSNLAFLDRFSHEEPKHCDPKLSK